MSEANVKMFASRPNRPKLGKPRPWTHQDDLKALKGKKVTLLFADDSVASGTLLDADQFTFKIFSDTAQSVVTYFKHSLAGYRAV